MKIRLFQKNDLELMYLWLNKAHIKKYFGDPDEWITEISNNINADWIKYFIIEIDSPIGFAQYYETDKAPQGLWSEEPIDTVGIDYLIGDEDILNKGFGTEIIKLLLNELKKRNKYDFVIADPTIENIPSIKVLQKNGFSLMPNGLYQLKISDIDVIIKKAKTSDIEEITHLFFNTIQSINIRDYPKDQIDDWSSWYQEYDKWKNKILEQYFIKALDDDKIVGFGSLAKDGYVDYLFVDKDYQRQGIATNLMKKLENKAIEQCNKHIYSDVSITAKSFFERNGFKVEKQQLKKSREKYLTNFRMIKNVN